MKTEAKFGKEADTIELPHYFTLNPVRDYDQSLKKKVLNAAGFEGLADNYVPKYSGFFLETFN